MASDDLTGILFDGRAKPKEEDISCQSPTEIYGGSGSILLHHQYLVLHQTPGLNRCQRQYYFEYIAPYIKSQPIVDPEKIRWLKNFTSKFVVQGQLIHDIIDQQIQLHCENKPMDLNEAMTAFSKKVSLYKNIGGETFTEYHNGEKIPNSFFTYIEENGKTCLQTFFGKWPGYLNRECLRHEEYDHFTIGDAG